MKYRIEPPIVGKEGIDLEIAEIEQQIEIHKCLIDDVREEIEKAHLTELEAEGIIKSIEGKIKDLNDSLLIINTDKAEQENRLHLMNLNEEFYKEFNKEVDVLRYLNQKGFIKESVLNAKLKAIKQKLVHKYQAKISLVNGNGCDITFGVDVNMGDSHGVIVEVVDVFRVKVRVDDKFDIWDTSLLKESEKELDEIPTDLIVEYESDNFLMNEMESKSDIKIELGEYVEDGVVFQKSKNTFLVIKCSDEASMRNYETSNFNKINIPKKGGFRLPLLAELIQLKVFFLNRGQELRGIYWSNEKKEKKILCLDMDAVSNEPILMDAKNECKWVLVKESN